MLDCAIVCVYIYSINFNSVHHPHRNTDYGYSTRTPSVRADVNSTFTFTFTSPCNGVQVTGECRWKFHVFCSGLHVTRFCRCSVNYMKGFSSHRYIISKQNSALKLCYTSLYNFVCRFVCVFTLPASLYTSYMVRVAVTDAQ